MLSDESAMGKYPIEAIATMKRVILYTQEHEPVRPLLYSDEVHRAKELRAKDFFEPKSTVVIVPGQQPGIPGGTDTIRVRVLE